jgi:transposase InsO family protein
VTSQPAAPVQPIQVPARRFSHIHVDLVGPLPVAADGSTYLLTIFNRSTRWLEAVPLRNMETTTCVEALISTSVSRYGVPSNITTDRGQQFTSALWSGLCHRLGVTHITTTAYHPQSNGMVERAHRQIKDALRARLAGVEWPQHLPWVLLGLRAAPKEDAPSLQQSWCLGLL